MPIKHVNPVERKHILTWTSVIAEENLSWIQEGWMKNSLLNKTISNIKILTIE